MDQTISPPRIPTGRELYDAIMGHIEPELTTAGVETLNAKYKNETPEQAAQRQQRYDIALATYDKAYAEYQETLNAQVTKFRRESFVHAEKEDRAQDENAVRSFDQMFLQAA